MIGLEATSTKSRIHIDPRTKFLLLFFVGFFMFTIPPMPIEIGVFAGLALLLALSGQGRSCLGLGVAFALMLLLDLSLSPMMTGTFSFVFNTLVRLLRLIFPIYLAAILLMRTTTVGEFIAAFRKLRLPDAFIIPVSVMFRFIPTIGEEWRCIRNAMRFRGIGVSVKTVAMRPLQTLEYTLIPLLMSTATISDELAAASLSRGLDSGSPRTTIMRVYMGALDYALLLICAGLAIHSLIG